MIRHALLCHISYDLYSTVFCNRTYCCQCTVGIRKVSFTVTCIYFVVVGGSIIWEWEAYLLIKIDFSCDRIPIVVLKNESCRLPSLQAIRIVVTILYCKEIGSRMIIVRFWAARWWAWEPFHPLCTLLHACSVHIVVSYCYTFVWRCFYRYLISYFNKNIELDLVPEQKIYPLFN